jgi:hypothetical protein
MSLLPAKPAALSTRKWESIQSFHAAIDQHDWNLLDEVLTPDWAAPASGQQPGPDGVKPISEPNTLA